MLELTPAEINCKIEAYNAAKEDRLYNIWLQGHLDAYAFHDSKHYPKFKDLLPKKLVKPVPPEEIRQDLLSLQP